MRFNLDDRWDAYIMLSSMDMTIYDYVDLGIRCQALTAVVCRAQIAFPISRSGMRMTGGR